MLALGALLPIINPAGNAPIFLSLTAGASDTARAALARAVAINCGMLLIGTTLVGSYVLNFFGLSLGVIKIAGGLLVIVNGWRLINASGHPTDVPPRTEAAIAGSTFYPLTFPLTVGPGSISVALTLGAGARMRDTSPFIGFLGTVLGLLLVAVAIYLCYRFAFWMVRRLGESGTAIFLRLSAFILLAIGVQIFCDGLADRFEILRQ